MKTKLLFGKELSKPAAKPKLSLLRKLNNKPAAAPRLQAEKGGGIKRLIAKGRAKASPHMAAPGATQPKPISYDKQATPTFSNPKKRWNPWTKM